MRVNLTLQQFIKNEMRSCLMDIGEIPPVYVYRMGRVGVALEEIEEAFKYSMQN